MGLWRQVVLYRYKGLFITGDQDAARFVPAPGWEEVNRVVLSVLLDGNHVSRNPYSLVENVAGLVYQQHIVVPDFHPALPH